MLKVRTYPVDADNTVVFADIRVTNPSTQQFVVQDVKVLLEPRPTAILETEIVFETDAQRLFTYYPVLGKKYNPNLMIRQKINSNETIDRMISVRFPGTESKFSKAQGAPHHRYGHRRHEDRDRRKVIVHQAPIDHTNRGLPHAAIAISISRCRMSMQAAHSFRSLDRSSAYK